MNEYCETCGCPLSDVEIEGLVTHECPPGFDHDEEEEVIRERYEEMQDYQRMTS